MPEGQDPSGTTTTGGTEGGNTSAGVQGAGSGENTQQIGGTTAQGSGTTGQDKKTFDEDYVKKLREESAGYRTELREVQKELKELKQAGLSDADKLAAKLKELEDDNRNLQWRQRSAEIKAQAAALGCKKPDLIVRLVEDDVEEANLPKVLAQLKKDNPELFLNTTGSADGGSGAGGSGTGAGKSVADNMNFLIRQAAGRT